MCLRLFRAFYEPFKVFLRLFINLDKVGVEPAACEKIDICLYGIFSDNSNAAVLAFPPGQVR